MFQSLTKGLKMIFASLGLAWQDKRVLLPSVLTVFANIFFGMVLLVQGSLRLHTSGNHSVRPPDYADVLGGFGSLNGAFDPSGFNFLHGFMNQQSVLLFSGLIAAWWLTNRFLEGVTTALVYSNLSQGPGSGKFSTACAEVFSSLPAIVALGAATFLARRLAGLLRNRRAGLLGMLATAFEIFWTLAGHLILPAIVVEGTSFLGGLKRADQIASGNLITMGIGEVGVDAVCRAGTWLTYLAGAAGYGYVVYYHVPPGSSSVLLGAGIWAACVVMVTALSIYLRAAFYTCLYAWAIDAEAVHVDQRKLVMPPSPLAAALA